MAKDDEQELLRQMQADMHAIANTNMPFGKYGPDHFPPLGMPIFDLPAEYLAWFASKDAWPKGRLGRLLRIVHQMKVDGSDFAFDAMRKANGGPTPLRKPRQRIWKALPSEDC